MKAPVHEIQLILFIRKSAGYFSFDFDALNRLFSAFSIQFSYKTIVNIVKSIQIK